VVGGFHPCRLGQAQVATLLSPFSLSLLSFFYRASTAFIVKNHFIPTLEHQNQWRDSTLHAPRAICISK